MYQLIIVDDEQLIRNGLARNIDWGSLNIRVSGCFEDGQDALDFLENNPVDIVLTDVKMYNVTGLEVAQYVQRHCSDTSVVIISGFREFDFAREAMRYGVSDYLLKPLDPDEIVYTFQKIAQWLDQRRAEQERPAAGQLPDHRKLLDSVLRGTEQEIQNAFQQWETAQKQCPAGQSQPAQQRLLDELYAQLDQVGVLLPDGLQRQAISDGSAAEPAYLLDFLQSLSGFLKSKKCLDAGTLVENAKAYIQTHLSADFSVEDLSGALFISSRHLRREFHRITGKGVVDYMLQCRMEKAMELLKHTNERTTQIAEQAGYADAQYFQRVFKKYTGYSVREYRKITHE